MSEGPIVSVTQGELLGRVATTPSGVTYYSFQGIPYARPPVGTLRFKEAQPADPWEGVRDATTEGNVCAQIQTFPHFSGFIGGEDCLYINVYTPNLEGEFLPVMFWIHSGAFNQGSGNSDLSGPDFLIEKDVILVTFNYRTGPLGFLGVNSADAPGNAGLKDQVLALKWVKENIASFGGNSGNVTVFGEGAGGASSSYLTLSPTSKDLMSKVILQSGTSLNPFALVEDPLDNAKELAKSLGNESDDSEEVFLYLQAASVWELVDSANKLELKFGPVIEKEFPGSEAFMAENPLNILTSGRGAKIPTIVGRTAEEASVNLASNFSIDDDLRHLIPKSFGIEHNSEKALELAGELKQFYFNGAHIGMDTVHQYLKLLGDSQYAVDIHRYIQILVNISTQPVYSYRFSYLGGLNLMRKILESFDIKHAGHMDELGYLFSVSSLKEAEVSPADIFTRETMVQLWTNFAKTGNPTPDENSHLTVSWLPVTPEHRYYLDVDEELTLATDQDGEAMSLWERWYHQYYKSWSTPGTPIRKDVEQNNAQDSPVNARFEYQQDQIPPNDASEVDSAQTIDDHKEETNEDRKEETNEVSDVKEVEETIQAVVEPCVYASNGIDKNGFNGVEQKEEEEVISKFNKVIKEEEEKIANGANDIIRANDPPEDDLPKNIGVNKFVNFFESLGGKK